MNGDRLGAFWPRTRLAWVIFVRVILISVRIFFVVAAVIQLSPSPSKGCCVSEVTSRSEENAWTFESLNMPLEKWKGSPFRAPRVPRSVYHSQDTCIDPKISKRLHIISPTHLMPFAANTLELTVYRAISPFPRLTRHGRRFLPPSRG